MPQDIFRLLRAIWLICKEPRAATRLDIIRLLTAPFLTAGYQSDSFDFALVQKHDVERNPEDTKDDRYIFTFRGTLAAELLRKMLPTPLNDESRDIFQVCGTTSPYTAALSGYVFKNIALGPLISGPSLSTEILSLGLFVPMAMLELEDVGKFPCHFVYTPLCQTQPTLSVESLRCSQASSPPRSPSRLPGILRMVTRNRRLRRRNS